MTTKQVGTLFNNPTLKNLKHLNLRFNLDIFDGLKLLATSPYVKELETLNLRNTNLSPDVIELLVSSLNFSKLQTLDLSLNYGIGDLCAIALMDKPTVRFLRVLNLEQTNLTNESVRLLSENPYLINLKTLDISQNPQVDLRQF